MEPRLVGEVSYHVLTRKFQNFLSGTHEIETKQGRREITLTSENLEAGVPIYLRVGSDFELVKGYSLNPKMNTHFEKIVKTTDLPLYRGGAIANGIIESAVLCAYDDRYGFAKPIGAGVARYDEGMRLHETGRRELLEELLLGLKSDMTTLLVPPGTLERFQTQPLIDKPNKFVSGIKQVQEIGSLDEGKYVVNEENRAFEGISVWNTGLSINEVYAVYMEPFPVGDIASDAVMLVAIDDDIKISNLKAICMARKGFVKFPLALRKHPSVLALNSLYKPE